MEEPTVNNGHSTKKYSVGGLYKKSWETVKKNLGPLAIVTLIGVAINVVISAVVVFAVVNNLVKDVSSAIISGFIGATVAVLAGVFVSLLQVLALKKASEGHKVVPGEVMSVAMKFVPRAVAYGAFVVGIMIAASTVLVVLGRISGGLAVLGGLALIVAFVIAIFRYAFVQFLIVEPKEMSFMERFKVSQKLTDGIYGTMLLLWLVAFLLGIVGGIVSGILTSPFGGDSTETTSTVQFDLNDSEDLEQFQTNLQDALDEETEDSFSVNFLLVQFITGAISWGVGLVVLGAALELYNKRKKDTHASL